MIEAEKELLKTHWRLATPTYGTASCKKCPLRCILRPLESADHWIKWYLHSSWGTRTQCRIRSSPNTGEAETERYFEFEASMGHIQTLYQNTKPNQNKTGSGHATAQGSQGGRQSTVLRKWAQEPECCSQPGSATPQRPSLQPQCCYLWMRQSGHRALWGEHEVGRRGTDVQNRPTVSCYH